MSEEEEKTYTFTAQNGFVADGIWKETKTIVKESELTQPQKDLLLGNLINTFNQCPDEVKTRFINGIAEKLTDEMKC